MDKIVHAKQYIEDYLLNVPKKLVFREKIWLTWQSDNVIFDPMCYGVRSLLYVAPKAQDKMQAIFCDTAIEYYSDGSREVVEQPLEMLINSNYTYWETQKYINEHCKSKVMFIDEERARNLFPEQKEYFDKLDQKYPLLSKYWRFWVSSDTTKFRLAMDIDASCRKLGFVNSEIYDKDLPYSDLTQLREMFAAFSVISANNATKVLDDFQDKKTYWIKYGERREKIKISIGYSSIPYNVAITVVTDEESKKQLRKEYCAGYNMFDVSISGKFIGHSVPQEFDEELGSMKGLVTTAPIIYTKWGAPLSEKDLEKINRERIFPYYNPDIGKMNRFRKGFAKFKSLF